MTRWSLHSQNSANPLADYFPPGHLHFATGSRASEVAADIAVALAGGSVGCGLGPDRFGLRTSLAGFCGVAAGAPVPVAVGVDGTRSRRIGLDIEAARLARGVSRELPIATFAARFDLAPELASGGLRIADAASALGRPPRFAILDHVDLGGDARTRAAGILLMQRDISRGTALLVVTDKVPPGFLSEGSTLIQVDDEHITMARSPLGTWRRRFTMARIETGSGEALAIRPGAAVEYSPEPIEQPAEAAPAAVEAPWEPAVKGAVITVSRPLSPAEQTAWGGHRIVFGESEAVPTREQVELHGPHEIVIVPTDRDLRREEASRKAWNIGALLRDRGIEDRVRVVVADQHIRFAA